MILLTISGRLLSAPKAKHRVGGKTFMRAVVASRDARGETSNIVVLGYSTEAKKAMAQWRQGEHVSVTGDFGLDVWMSKGVPVAKVRLFVNQVDQIKNESVEAERQIPRIQRIKRRIKKIAAVIYPQGTSND